MLDIKKHVRNSVAILPAQTMVGEDSLQDLRQQKDVAIPQGVQEIGE